MIYLVIT